MALGSMPQDCQSRAKATCRTKFAGWATSVRVMRESASLASIASAIDQPLTR